MPPAAEHPAADCPQFPAMTPASKFPVCRTYPPRRPRPPECRAQSAPAERRTLCFSRNAAIRQNLPLCTGAAVRSVYRSRESLRPACRARGLRNTPPPAEWIPAHLRPPIWFPAHKTPSYNRLVPAGMTRPHAAPLCPCIPNLPNPRSSGQKTDN